MSTVRFEGGPYHGKRLTVLCENGVPWPWIHMVPPIESLSPTWNEELLDGYMVELYEAHRVVPAATPSYWIYRWVKPMAEPSTVREPEKPCG